jgi:hypothetical protein
MLAAAADPSQQGVLARELDAAERHARRALAIQLHRLGSDHIATAGSLDRLAGVLRDQGDLAAARPLLERVLAIREHMLGPDHPRTAETSRRLASLVE